MKSLSLTFVLSMPLMLFGCAGNVVDSEEGQPDFSEQMKVPEPARPKMRADGKGLDVEPMCD